MATFNRVVGNQALTPLSANALRSSRVPVEVDAVIDMGVTGNTYTAADIFEVLQVPAGYAVLLTGLEVLKADTAGNSGTVQVKIGSTAQGSAVTVAATGLSASAGTVTPTAATGTAAFINLVTATGAVNAVLRVFAVIIDIRYRPGTGVVIGTTTTPAGATNAQLQDPVSNYTTALVYVT